MQILFSQDCHTNMSSHVLSACEHCLWTGGKITVCHGGGARWNSSLRGGGVGEKTRAGCVTPLMTPNHPLRNPLLNFLPHFRSPQMRNKPLTWALGVHFRCNIADPPLRDTVLPISRKCHLTHSTVAERLREQERNPRRILRLSTLWGASGRKEAPSKCHFLHKFLRKWYQNKFLSPKLHFP